MDGVPSPSRPAPDPAPDRPGRDAPGPGELTVDQLAAAVGITVRNVRAYAARGLLPPPRLVGRTGYYGPEHEARLVLVREMLAEGHTLAEISRVLQGAPDGAGPAALALHRALLSPFLPEEPEEIDVATLAARAGTGADPGLLDQLVELGLVERVDGARLRVLDPTLLAAGLQAVRLGIRPDALVGAQARVIELVEEAAEVYVQMFRDTVWQGFVERGAPQAAWPELSSVVAQVQPVAVQALLASFRTALAEAVERALETEMGAVPGGGQQDPA